MDKSILTQEIKIVYIKLKHMDKTGGVYVYIKKMNYRKRGIK